jgi:hypothetical protein
VPLQQWRHLVQLLPIRHSIGKCPVRHTPLWLRLWFYIIQGFTNALWKNLINGQMRNKPFLIVIYHSSLVKAAMNALRVCKLCNGVKKTPQFLLFSLAKGGTKTIAHLSITEGSSFWSLDRCIYMYMYNGKLRNEYSPQLSKLLYNWQVKNKEAL